MVTILIIILTLSAVAYTLEIIFFQIGIKRLRKISKPINQELSASVIVAARNEEENIEECLKTLIQLDYPREKLEIIIVDDHSTDKTAEIIERYASQNNSLKFHRAGPQSGNLRGKANALHHGINISSGEILIFTDADCRVNKNWVREIISHFDESIGIVGGGTFLITENTFHGMQHLDWFYLFKVAAAMTGWGMPLTAIGNNLAIRRNVYNLVGGYEKIKFSVTEDFALVQAVLQNTKFKLTFNLSHDAFVQSKACQSITDLFRQKQRWGVGGLDMIPPGLLAMAIGWIFKVMLIAGIFFAPLSIWLACFLLKCFTEILYLKSPRKQFGAKFYFKYFPAFEIYFILYVIILPFVAYFNQNIVWKKRKL